MKTKPIKLRNNERIIAIVPETCSGPGWSNRVLWVYITDSSNQLRTECIQGENLSKELWALFTPAEAMQNALRKAIEQYCR